MIALKEVVKEGRLQTDFFTQLSHELRTPISIIVGSVQLLELQKQRGLITAQTDTVDRQLKALKQNGYRLLKTVNNLLDITRLNAGFYHMNMQYIDMVDMVRELAESTAGYAEKRDLRLTFDSNVYEKMMPCDPDKVENAILGLLSNAVKFTDKGGKIHISFEDQGDMILITIRDTGIGIPEEKMSVIFDQFRQVDLTLTRRSEGCGLGLALVKAFVEMHGGTISVNSACGLGSEFSIRLPVFKAEPLFPRPVRDGEMKARIQEKAKTEFADITWL